jgi:transcription initiation factor TFIIE subunit beta
MTGSRKKKILYFNDKTTNEPIQIEEELVKYWRNVPVDGLDENKIEEYLESRGITSMKDSQTGSSSDKSLGIGLHKKSKERKRNRNFKKHNEHLGGLLNEYNPDLVAERRKK